MGLLVTWAGNLGINSSTSPCHSPHSQTVILSCKSSLHNCSWICTFLHIPTANSLVQVPSIPFLEPVKASSQLPYPQSFTSVIYFLFCCQITCPEAQFWWWNSHRVRGLGMGTQSQLWLATGSWERLIISLGVGLYFLKWGVEPGALTLIVSPLPVKNNPNPNLTLLALTPLRYICCSQNEELPAPECLLHNLLHFHLCSFHLFILTSIHFTQNSFSFHMEILSVLQGQVQMLSVMLSWTPSWELSCPICQDALLCSIAGWAHILLLAKLSTTWGSTLSDTHHSHPQGI